LSPTSHYYAANHLKLIQNHNGNNSLELKVHQCYRVSLDSSVKFLQKNQIKNKIRKHHRLMRLKPGVPFVQY